MPSILYYVNPPPRLPFDAVFFYTHFESIDGYLIERQNPNDVECLETYLAITSNEGEGIHPLLRKRAGYFFYDLTWDRERQIKFAINFEFLANVDGIFWIGTGNIQAKRGAWIYCHDGYVYAASGDGSVIQQTELMDLDGDTFETWNCKIRHLPASHVEFWEGGILRASHSVRIPSGDTSAEFLFEIYAECHPANGDAAKLELRTSYIELYQEKSF